MNKLFRVAAIACFITVGFTACEKNNHMPDDDTDPEHQPKVVVKDGETKDLANVSTTSNTQGTISRDGERYALRNFRQFVMEDGKQRKAWRQHPMLILKKMMLLRLKRLH